MVLTNIQTSLLIAVTSPFALPMLLFKLRNLDQGIGPSFDTIISAAYVLALGTCALVAHARNVLANYDTKIKTQPTVTSYILSGPVSVSINPLSLTSHLTKYCRASTKPSAPTFKVSQTLPVTLTLHLLQPLPLALLRSPSITTRLALWPLEPSQEQPLLPTPSSPRLKRVLFSNATHSLLSPTSVVPFRRTRHGDSLLLCRK